MAKHYLSYFGLLCAIIFNVQEVMAAPQASRIKDIGRIEGVRENALVGYGLVAGLSGSGDSGRNRSTQQSLINTLSNFGVQISEDDLNTRNVAAVMVTAVLPPFAEPGAKINVLVSAMADARSLAGGTLLLTPLYGADKKLYALAQGAMTVGGYRVESFASSLQKNHPTVGQITNGATIEQSIYSSIQNKTEVTLLLNHPDYTTANRVVNALRGSLLNENISAKHAGKITIAVPSSVSFNEYISRIENISVISDHPSRVVVNERTGIVVAGGEAIISPITIAHGNVEISVSTKFRVSQPFYIGRAGEQVQTEVVPDTEIVSDERESSNFNFPEGSTVGDLVRALHSAKLSTRDVISVLEAIQSAGALNAELVIQ